MYSNTLHHFLKLHISSQRCFCLTATLLLQLLIFFFFNRALQPPPHHHSSTSSSASKHYSSDHCRFGKVYVYNLPPILNKQLLERCNDLDPWSSRCTALSNGGFGPPATGLERLMPRNLTGAWYWTDLYAGEVIYHEKILKYRCRTENRDEATGFYIPFYVGLSIGKLLWLNHTAKEIDFHSEMMLNWVKNQDPWKRRNGSDHFIMLGRLTWDFRRLQPDSNTEWGTSFLYMPLMNNVLRLTPERNVWDGLEISVPYPNPFHPRSESDIRQWQSFLGSKERRKSLFSFVGGARKKIKNDFRGLVMNYCRNESGSCRLVDCSVTRCLAGDSSTLEAFLESDFCLMPKGDGYTRRATFDCMVMGGIPVFFWRGSFENQYQWHLPEAAETYSVFVDNKDVRNDPRVIGRVLEKFSREEVEKMRDRVIDLIPNIVISNSSDGNFRDAFDISMDGVLKMFHHQKNWFWGGGVEV